MTDEVRGKNDEAGNVRRGKAPEGHTEEFVRHLVF